MAVRLADLVRNHIRGYAWVKLLEIPLVYPYDDFALLARALDLSPSKGLVWAVRTEGVLAIDRALTLGRPCLTRTISIGGTGVASFTASYKANNARVEEVLSILTAFGIPFETTASAAQLLEIFDTSVREAERDGSTVYIYAAPREGDPPKAIAMKFVGPGLWGLIEGFLALEADMKTIRGLTFSRQEETPGLGGEIALSWFREQFVGKSIIDRAGQPGISIGGGQGGQNAVDAITGATMTCDKLEAILDEVIGKFVEESHEEQ